MSPGLRGTWARPSFHRGRPEVGVRAGEVHPRPPRSAWAVRNQRRRCLGDGPCPAPGEITGCGNCLRLIRAAFGVTWPPLGNGISQMQDN